MIKKQKAFLIGLLAISLAACGNKSAVEQPENKIKKEIVKNENVIKEDKKEKMDVVKYNEFASESYSSIFKDYIKDSKEKNLIYSPYSYKMALEGLGKVTNSFDKDSYLSEAVKENMSQNLSSVKTKNLVMLDKTTFDTKDKGISLVSFPDEAAKLSIDTQKEVLGHVLLEPKYSIDVRFVSLNATKFESKWKAPFKRTETDEFNTLDGAVSDKDFLYGEIDNIAYVDEDVEVGRKKLKEDGSYVYFVNPKKSEKEDLQKVASKISDYIETFNRYMVQDSLIGMENIKDYDEVNISLPKIDTESTIDILKAEVENGHPQLASNFKYKDSIKSSLKDGSIDSIMQVANMKLDEEGVKAEAVTEILTKTALAPEKEKDILNIDCSNPHFVVCVSEGIITFVGFIGY